METWHNLVLIVTPKAYTFEDRAIYSMQGFNVLGYNTKYFIELFHQYFAHQDRLTKFLRGYKQNQKSKYKAEHQASHPKLHELK